MSKHLKAIQKRIEAQRKKEYHCGDCSKVFKNLDVLMIHEEEHEKKKIEEETKRRKLPYKK